MFASLSVFVFFWFTSVIGKPVNVILPPIKNTPEKYALVFIQGAKINNSLYIPLAQQIQHIFPYSLTVGLPGFVDTMPDPLIITESITDCLSSMVSSGYLPNNEILNVFLGGHSLGGAILQKWTHDNQFTYQSLTPKFKYIAQIQVGSTITKAFRDSNTQRVTNYTIPTITIGGEFDGLFRVTRLIEEYYVQLSGNYSTNSNIANFPVIYIPGMNHMQWASGKPPIHVYEHDLLPTISFDEAHEIGGILISSYMQVQIHGYRNDPTNFNTIYTYVNKTQQFGQPMINMLKLESFYSFKKPCYCNTQTCQNEWNCNGGNIFISQYGLNYLIGSNSFGLLNIDSFHDSSNYLPTLDTTHNVSTSVTNNIYAFTDDTGFCPTASFEMRTKFVSNETIQYYYNNNTQAPGSYDNNNCQMINKRALSMAIENTPADILSRYYNITMSEPLRIDDDLLIDGPKLWAFELLRYRNKKDENGNPYMAIRSPYYVESLKDSKNNIGYHFCKLLSPARAMEWIYIGSLRKKHSYSGNSRLPTQCRNE